MKLHRDSRAQEDTVVKRYNGSRSVMSGAGSVRKNDVRNEEFLFECKRTDNAKSITIKAADLQDVTKNALIEGRTPVLLFDVGGRSYVILNERDFHDRFGV